MTTSISLVIPTYNGAAFIQSALASVYAQTLLPTEIIVVDDASTDGTPEIVASLSQQSAIPLRLIRRMLNSGGPAVPINAALAEARGELISILDQDDVFLPGRLETLATLLVTQPDVSVAFSACGRVGAPNRPASTWQSNALLRHIVAQSVAVPGGYRIESARIARLLLAHGNFIIGYPGYMFRRADWLAKGGVDESLAVGSDYDLLCWLSLRGPAAFVPERLYLRRLHPRNLSGSGAAWGFDLARVMHRYLPQVRADPNDAAFWDPFGRLLLKLLSGLGWAGRHAPAFRLLVRGLRAGGPFSEALLVTAKLIYTWGWRHLLRRRLRRSPGDADAFLESLDVLFTAFRRRELTSSSPRPLEERGRG